MDGSYRQRPHGVREGRRLDISEDAAAARRARIAEARALIAAIAAPPSRPPVIDLPSSLTRALGPFVCDQPR